MRSAQVLLALLTTLFARATVHADDRPSGPAVGEPVPPLRVYAVGGSVTGAELDLARIIGSSPGAVLFIHELSRNTAPLIRGVHELGDELREAGFHGRSVLLQADRNSAEETAARVSGALKLREPIAVSLDGAEGPGAWALDRNAALTLVTMRGGRVLGTTTWTDTGHKDLPELRRLVDEAVGDLRTAIETALPTEPEALRARAVDLALEVRRLRAEIARLQGEPARDQPARRDMRPAAGDRPRARGEAPTPGAGERPRDGDRGPRPPLVGKAPDDDELRRLLRAVIWRFASDADVDASFAAIEKRIGDDEGLEKEAVEMFRLLLHLGYGGEHAKARATKWLEARGVEPPPGPEEAGAAPDRKPPTERPAPRERDADEG